MRVFLLALQHGDALDIVPTACALGTGAHDFAVFTPTRHLRLGLKLNGSAQGLEGVEILHFNNRRLHFRAIGQLNDHVDVGLEAHVALLHDSLSYTKESAYPAQFLRKCHYIRCTIKVGCSDHFQERSAGAIEINQRTFVVEPARQFMPELACVLFKVRTNDSNAACSAGWHWQFKRAIVTERQVILTDLIPLRKIGVVVVLAIPLGAARNAATERKTHHHAHLHSTKVHHWQRAGQRGHGWSHQ